MHVLTSPLLQAIRTVLQVTGILIGGAAVEVQARGAVPVHHSSPLLQDLVHRLPSAPQRWLGGLRPAATSARRSHGHSAQQRALAAAVRAEQDDEPLAREGKPLRAYARQLGGIVGRHELNGTNHRGSSLTGRAFLCWSCLKPGQNWQVSPAGQGAETSTPREQAWVDVVKVLESRKISPATCCQAQFSLPGSTLAVM